MKFRYVGIFAIISGFAIPLVLNNISSLFMCFILPSLFIWSGFLLLLFPLKNSETVNIHLKWARYGVYFAIIVNLISILCVKIFFYFGFHGYIAGQILRIFGFIVNPTNSLFDFLMPLKTINRPDGSVLYQVSFIRTSLAYVLNLLFYAIAGICLQLIKERKNRIALESSGGN